MDKLTVMHLDSGTLFDWKEMNYRITKRHGGTLNVYYKVKKTNLKKLRTAWLQLYDILEKAEMWKLERLVVARGCGRWDE